MVKSRARILIGAALLLASVALAAIVVRVRYGRRLGLCAGRMELVGGGESRSDMTPEEHEAWQAQESDLRARVPSLPVVATWKLVRENHATEGEEIDIDYALGPFTIHQGGTAARYSMPKTLSVSLTGACFPASVHHEGYMSGSDVELVRDAAHDSYIVVTREDASHVPPHDIGRVTEVRIR